MTVSSTTTNTVLVLMMIVVMSSAAAPCAPNLPAFDYLFVAHDAGESLGFKPVMAQLSSVHETSCGVIALGEPATRIFNANFEHESVSRARYDMYNQMRNVTVMSPLDVGVYTKIIDGDGGRHQELSTSDMMAMSMCIVMKKHGIVVVGMAYKMQSQIARLYKSMSVYTVAFDDGFGLWDNNSPFSTWFISGTPVINEIFVTAQSISDAIPRTVVTTTTGSPTLDDWSAIASDSARISFVRRAIYGNNVKIPTVMFAGGYGSGYNASLDIYCNVARQLGTAGVMMFSFSPHPGYDPSFESEYFRSHGCPSIIVLEPHLGFTTAEVCAASNVSVSQTSTVGGQSLSVGVPHAYLHSNTTQYDDVFTMTSLIPVCTDDNCFYRLLTYDFANIHYKFDPSRLSNAGVPRDGTNKMKSRLMTLANEY